MLGELDASKLTSVRVGVIGIGGVGSWSANALVRSGVKKITLVDPDIIVESNINRQCHANYDNLGKPKVVAMEEMLRQINPGVEVTGFDEEFCESNAKKILDSSNVDYWIDACDSVKAKVSLASNLGKTSGNRKTFLICGAAGGKINPHKFICTDLGNAKNDSLLSKVRYALRRHHDFPRSAVMKVSCITSTELSKKARAGNARISCAGYGSIVTVTATVGLLAASETITQIIKQES
ncbi:ThiF family adenylyltransferase [Betaproteobacteria bacterium]|nr:ThiF family adenylyltransferase [Betaproteobacteria bacterium]